LAVFSIDVETLYFKWPNAIFLPFINFFVETFTIQYCIRQSQFPEIEKFMIR